MNTKLPYYALLATALVLLWVMLENIKAQDELYEQRKAIQYCLDVDAWEDDEAAGIPDYDRAGHPNYEKRECNKEQQQ